ncbi:MAG: Rieske (2Fe-2S) protein [Chloroflexi bacterium]|nr:Rieske (2Fe-2S) protein [Chloroflexota bacterium]
MTEQEGRAQSTFLMRRKLIRTLIGFSVASTLGGILVPVIGYLWPKSAAASYAGPVVVGNAAEFPPGSGTVVSVNSKPVIVVNTKAGGLKAYSAICTHLGCVVYWHPQKNVIHSPCHDGLFNPVNGSVISGPPPRPLPEYELTVREGKVIIGKARDRIYGA